jgi:multidrug efflux pump subunit AcrB
MTSLAFILGVVPLILSSGAGAAGRISIGIGVFGGMVAATILAVLLVPLFYRLIAPAHKAAVGSLDKPADKRPDEHVPH